MVACLAVCFSETFFLGFLVSVVAVALSLVTAVGLVLILLGSATDSLTSFLFLGRLGGGASPTLVSVIWRQNNPRN